MSSKTRIWNQSSDRAPRKSHSWPTVCFTGHRPADLFGYDMSDPRYRKLEDRINQVARLMQERRNVKSFISGMALGVDQIAFRAMLGLKRAFTMVPLHLVAAVPFKDQAVAWPEQQQKTYRRLLEMADEIVEVDLVEGYKIPNAEPGKYAASKLHLRNRYMVDRADAVIAIWNGKESGGTYSCVSYAAQQDKPITIIHPQTLMLTAINIPPAYPIQGKL